MTDETPKYQPQVVTRKVMRHVEYERQGDHVVISYMHSGGLQQIPMNRDQAEVLVQWMVADLYPDDDETPRPDQFCHPIEEVSDSHKKWNDPMRSTLEDVRAWWELKE